MAIPVFLLLFYYDEKKRKQTLKLLGSQTILMQIANLRSPFRSTIKMAFFLLFWIFACIALMKPAGNEHFKSQLSKTHSQEIYFLIDSSISMTVSDTPAKITRFDYAKEIADLVIKKMRGSDMELATFTTGINLIVPSTHDAIYLRIRLKDLEIHEGGNLPGTDFLNTLKDLKKASLTSLLLFSDGGDIALEGLTGSDKARKIAQVLEVISSKNLPELRIDAIGIGSLQGGIIPQTTVLSKLEPSLLQELSKSTGGNYYSANEYTAEDLSDILVYAIRQQKAKGTAREILSTRAYDEYFQIPLFISIVFFLLYLLYPAVNKPIFSMFAMFVLQSLSASEDFMARQLFEAGEIAQAYSYYQTLLATSPEEFRPLINYNLGTVLLAENKPRQAIDKLEAIPWAENISSNVKRRALINLAAAYERIQLDVKDPLAKVHYLKKALLALSQADRLECDKAHCIPSSDFNSIKMALSNEIKTLTSSSLENGDLLALLWQSFIFSFNEENGAYPIELINNQELRQRLAQSIGNQDLRNLLEQASAIDSPQSWEKFKQFVSLYYEPLEILLQDLERLYILNQSKSLIQFLLQKAVLAFPELQTAKENINLSIREKDYGKAEFFFLNSMKEFQRFMLRENANLAKKALLGLIEEAKIAVKKELLFLRFSFEMASLKEEISRSPKTVLDAIGKLSQTIYEWQVLRFKEGVCQCKPWNEVFPLLRKGNELWEKSVGKEITYSKIADQQEAIQFWLKALEAMEKIPEGPEEASKSASFALNELQKMELLDKQPSIPQKLPQGGKFW